MNKPTMESVHFASFFSPANIICQTELQTRDQVIMELLKKLAYNHGIGNVDEVYDQVIKREDEYSTIITDGFAMPHARLKEFENLEIAIATSKQGIKFSDSDNGIVNIVILILTPVDQPSLYLQVLSSLSTIFINKDIISEISNIDTAEDIWTYFNRQNMHLPDYICAGDVMTPDPIYLRENDTLKHAIDLFVNRNLIDLPVVDKDGDLIGVVTAYELLKVCLPDYILWMDDLSPILNFEPFAHILQNEANTWLAEIMSQDYAVVSEDSPAIMVAQEITKRNTRLAYVLRDKKLVGIITLQQFLNKVLRE